MKFKMTAEEEKAMVAENAKLKAEAAAKPKEGFFSTTAGTVTVGAIGLGIGAGAGYLLFGREAEPAAKK